MITFDNFEEWKTAANQHKHSAPYQQHVWSILKWWVPPQENASYKDYFVQR